jgi:uncharacterized metal-binding protein
MLACIRAAYLERERKHNLLYISVHLAPSFSIFFLHGCKLKCNTKSCIYRGEQDTQQTILCKDYGMKMIIKQSKLGECIYDMTYETRMR